MRSRSILAVARKDALDLVLNPVTLGTLLIPVVVALLFALLSSVLNFKTTRLLIYNPGDSPVEQVLSRAFDGAQITHASSAGEVRDAFRSDGISPYAVGLVVPTDFEATARAGGPAQLELYLNGQAVNAQEQGLLKRALSDYARGLAQPQSPVTITSATINAAAADSTGNQFAAFYALLSVTTSFVVGVSLMPNLLVEEKEHKTLWMLMVSPATLADVVAGKLLVGLTYQVGLSLVTLAVQRAFVGQVLVVVLYVVLGSCFGVALGLLVGSLFKTSTGTGLFTGLTALVYIFPAFFAGPFGQLFESGLLQQAMRLLPTYYLADGLLSALQNQATLRQVALECAAVLGTTLLLFVAAVWTLRRQATVLATV